MKKQHTILCPIDFDVNSLAALDWARDLAHALQALLQVLHVVTLSDPLLIPAPFLNSRAREHASIRLDKIARESLGNVDHRLILKNGQPAEQIIQSADEVGADMLVMATHGRAVVSRFFLGGVTEKVLRLSPCPVLVIRGVLANEAEHTNAASDRTFL
jgi:nucleotide-binding universal stress UspA family protein